ncbi:pullulanase, type I [Alkalibacterium putridalgicola]|uniref:Pullulanase, type I n=1 Tax=Alkalibacterium putridalgicola TaxID=426703 RepID=A0A1H7UR50_9LACT|nr:type I pullulanase [Alkalibacterium putridalgicola]GEK88527.1 type I pullulanase [Alkalibacterium putridalgicola]SEL98897.1 pullulanase, type I [Alkalibacterium putridalgicola]
MTPEHPIEERIPYLEDHEYTGDDLGITYSPDRTLFKVWSPLAQHVYVNVYETADSSASLYKREMKLQNNCWTLSINEDLKGFFYTYSFIHNEAEVEAADIYSKAVGLNGDRSAVIDFSETDPNNWSADAYHGVSRITDAIIWEVHIEDFSSDQEAAFSPQNRGKYSAFTEEGVTVNGDPDQPAGLSYLKELGVNYIHLLPAFDFENDETSPAYNWGYDPKNYMVPEGKYSSDPSDPKSRIKEFKDMVSHLHKQDIGVILDVVFNHTYTTDDAWFQLTVPDYYYRQDHDGNFTNGSGCGNETASERRMMRKYIIDTVLYWADEYHIDGFRFDLMGLHDVDTMNLLRQTLDENGHADVLLYGEPWNAGSVAIYEPNKPADKFHVNDLADGIALFNDEYRDAIKGPVFDERAGGFLQGANGFEHSAYATGDLVASILANTQTDVGRFRLPEEKQWARTPAQVITYASAHDNLTLFDKLMKSLQDEPDYTRDETVIQLNKINAALLFTSLGGIFMQAGEEFGRTKLGDENSFRSSISINQLHWAHANENKDLLEYYKGMIDIRKAYAPLRDPSNKTGEAVTFSQLNENMLAYTIPNTLNEGDWTMMAVVVNTTLHPEEVELKSSYPLPSEWTIVANRHSAGLSSLGIIKGHRVLINPREVLILKA